MSEDQKKQLETQFWNIANTLRGKMNADETVCKSCAIVNHFRQTSGAKDGNSYVVNEKDLELVKERTPGRPKK